MVAVVAGWGHSALVTAAGHVYTAGRNVQGQLGLGPLEVRPPTLVTLDMLEPLSWWPHPGAPNLSVSLLHRPLFFLLGGTPSH